MPLVWSRSNFRFMQVVDCMNGRYHVNSVKSQSLVFTGQLSLKPLGFSLFAECPRFSQPLNILLSDIPYI